MMKNRTVNRLFPFLLLIFGLTVGLALANSRPVHAQNAPSGTIGLPEPQYCDSLGTAGTVYVSGVNCRIASVDGHPRAYIVYVPENAQVPAPAVFMFHGSSGDGLQFLRISGWREKADEVGLVAVFPTGLKYCKRLPHDPSGCAWITKWHSYKFPEDDDEFNFDRRLPGYPATAPWPADDVQFAQGMIDDLVDPALGLNIDGEQIYASGFSSGAGMTARLAVEAPDRLAAVGYVAAGIVAVENPENLPMPPADYIPVYAAIGANDEGIIETSGWDARQGELPLDPATFMNIGGMVDYFIRPHLDAFEHFYEADTLRPYVTREFPHSTLYRWRTPQVGGPQHIFQMAVLEGLEHKYPNGCHAKNPYCFNAADIFWSFFQCLAHPRLAADQQELAPAVQGLPQGLAQRFLLRLPPDQSAFIGHGSILSSSANRTGAVPPSTLGGGRLHDRIGQRRASGRGGRHRQGALAEQDDDVGFYRLLAHRFGHRYPVVAVHDEENVSRLHQLDAAQATPGEPCRGDAEPTLLVVRLQRAKIDVKIAAAAGIHRAQNKAIYSSRHEKVPVTSFAVLADFQVGMWLDNLSTAEKAVHRAVEARPAAILFLGDFVYHAVGPEEDEVEEVASLLAPVRDANIPAYAVLGNHDYRLSQPGAPDEAGLALARRLEATLEQLGIVVLENEAAVIEGPENAPLTIVGIGSHYARNDRPQEALAQVPAGASRIVIMHNPDSYVDLPAGAAPLALAGHLHGGQLAIPYTPNWSFLALVQPDEVHVDGWAEAGFGAPGNRLYVNRGIGMSIVPLRLFAPPELTLLTLSSAP